MSTRNQVESMSGAVLLFLFIGVTAWLLGCGALYWYFAHQLAWWTFALTYAGMTFLTYLLQAIFKTTRNN